MPKHSFTVAPNRFGSLVFSEVRPETKEERDEAHAKLMDASLSEEEYLAWYRTHQKPRSFTWQDVVDLEVLCREKGYVSSDDLYGQGDSGVVIDVEGTLQICPWLEWSAEVEQGAVAEGLIRRVIGPFEPFELESINGYHADEPMHPVPVAVFLRHWSPEDTSETDDQTAFYQELVRAYAEGTRIPFRNIPPLTAMRDAYEAQVRRAADRLREPMQHIENILRVVVAETAARMQAHDSTLWGDVDILLSDAYLRGMRFQIERLWKYRIGAGMPRRMFVQSRTTSLDEVAYKYTAPPLLGVTARQGIFFYLRERERILEAAHGLNQKRQVLEWLLYVALRGEDVPEWETISESLQGGDRSPGRPHDFPIEDTERWYVELSEQEAYQARGGKTKMVEEIIARHTDKTGDMPSERTIRRHISRIEQEKGSREI